MERFFDFINKHELDVDDFKECLDYAHYYYEENNTFGDYFHEETLKKVNNGKIKCILEGNNDDLNVKLALKIYKPTPMFIDVASEKLNFDKIKKFLNKKKETDVYLTNLKGRVNKDLSHVTNLTIEDCEDLILPDLPSVVTLFCNGNGIKKLPELPKCKHIECSSNKLTELPDLPECLSLECSNNKLKKLPDLPNCFSLDCGGNALKKLPDLPECKILDCSYNFITELPYIPKAIEIYCEENNLKSIPNLISNDLEILHMHKQPVYFDCDAILNNHPNLTDLKCDVPKKMKPMFSSVFSSRPARNYSQNSVVLEDISIRNKDFGRRYF